MPSITSSVNKEYMKAYDGYNSQQVGMGLLDPSIYATPQYKKKKTQNIAIGLLSYITYGGSENDRSPLILPMIYETQYNTLLAYNLNYATPVIRKAMLKFVLDSNAARIKSNLPILVDYHAMKRAIPDTQFLVRRYKVVGISVQDTPTLSEWATIAAERSRYDGFYLNFKSGRIK